AISFESPHPLAARAAILPPPLAGEGWGGGIVRAQSHRVFRREEASVREIRHDPKASEASALADRRDAAVEQARVAAEFVDDVADQPLALALRQQRVRSDELRDNAAALDIADQRDRHIGRFRKAHIGYVALTQID